jgi:myo-inositol-1(or 4)-monophosphatase
MALVARGAAVAALLDRARIWDIAAGAALLAATGGELRHLSGESVEMEALLGGERTKDYLVAARAGMIDEILSQLWVRQ